MLKIRLLIIDLTAIYFCPFRLVEKQILRTLRAFSMCKKEILTKTMIFRKMFKENFVAKHRLRLQYREVSIVRRIDRQTDFNINLIMQWQA